MNNVSTNHSSYKKGAKSTNHTEYDSYTQTLLVVVIFCVCLSPSPSYVTYIQLEDSSPPEVRIMSIGEDRSQNEERPSEDFIPADSQILPFVSVDQIIPEAVDDSEDDRIELLRLHESDKAHQEDALGHLNSSIENRIREGEILTSRRNKCKHGEWLSWIKANAPYDQKTVWNRINLYRRHCEGKLGNVPNLTDAYLQMAECTKPPSRRGSQKAKAKPKLETERQLYLLQTVEGSTVYSTDWQNFQFDARFPSRRNQQASR